MNNNTWFRLPRLPELPLLYSSQFFFIGGLSLQEATFVLLFGKKPLNKLLERREALAPFGPHALKGQVSSGEVTLSYL
jgi:hypothetical protein